MKSLSITRLQPEEDVPHLLLAIPWGIGDAISVGLSAVDQITRNDPDSHVKIEVVCNRLQSELLEHDPRIYRLIQVDTGLFPSGEAGSWKRGIVLPPATEKLAEFLRAQNYSAVMPFLFSPTFFYRLHTPVIFLSPREVWHLFCVLKRYGEVSLQTFIRQIINRYFGEKLPEPAGDEAIPLYICREHVQNAMREMGWIKGQASVFGEQVKVLLVAPDTSSVVTRPPTSLLAEGIAGALKRHDDLLVAVIPGYSDCNAVPNLMRALAPSFPGRIVPVPAEPKRPLPELAAFIDQSDIVITGDTGIMHLAVATKKIPHAAGEGDAYTPRNAVKIIVLYGGTHPGLYGYNKRTLTLGKWRKEQRALVPGLMKDLYHAEGKNLFDHIPPQQLTDAILSQLRAPVSSYYSRQNTRPIARGA
ncbi:MAG TPA: glycosyltransferase family 9 protein [Ktedonobacteraceae bacterium]|nr:glycosyltransferase family 9 protein [Ktedonobacteraceae bacterium]